jgi:exopolyphosphatase/guanosine-5'-triphosphate,3'-diphosphate pyrophosphatase
MSRVPRPAETITVARGDRPSVGAGDSVRAAGGTRLAAIDVGTNSIRLVVVEVLADGSFRVMDDEKVLARLGRGMAADGALSAAAMDTAAEAVMHLKTIADGYGASQIRAVGTCAIREASNGTDFVQLVRERAGLELKVISSEEEARLAFTSVANAFDIGSMMAAVVDIGGGSTEVVLSSGSVIERICPLELGAVRLTEMFDLGGESIGEHQYREMRQHVKRAIRTHIGRPPFVPQIVVGTGGTFSSLASMSMNRGSSGIGNDSLPFSIRGYELQRSEVKHFLDHLRKLTVRERTRTPGLNADRADIIVAGLTIADCVLKHLGVNRVRVHDEGIRTGLIYEMLSEGTSPEPVRETSVDRLRSVRRFAASCDHDHQHAEHVTALALQLFDELARQPSSRGEAWASAESRDLLHAAALLHDVGYLINYSKHHKHSYHLIIHSRLAGFTHREMQIIANVARYHRGADPKRKHRNFSRLSVEDQALVRRLAAILRLCVGLDRSHTQRVRSVHVACYDETALVEIAAEREPCVELWGAQRKCRLFEEVFGKRARFLWSGHESRDDLESVNGR